MSIGGVITVAFVYTVVLLIIVGITSIGCWGFTLIDVYGWTLSGTIGTI